MTKKKYAKEDKVGYLDFNHTRSAEQIKVMKQIVKDGVCPFCHFTKYHPKPILKETKWWYLTENMTPYEGTKLSLILVYKKHITMPSEVAPEASKELFELIGWVEKKYKLEGGSIFIRFGKSEMTGGSVDHFHIQLIVGNAKGTDKKYDKLKIKLGYKKIID